eukprot:CAMPEP_0175570556 /NCGR_PEP_ID=MMETSP0096-20121207/42054_1 /TAXON_ID=311494 /ORGANISM="Alexandrium monilatum, Strain CCMP3105" /LENGTH=158 /DNA_ID=CAMNT_0016873945 /DNA_START=31 /DNA_END=504 /DNA_ORIENTATION=-
MEALVGEVKRLQRASTKFRDAWTAHCEGELGGVRDPNRHDVAVLQDFMDWWVAEGGEADDAPPSALVDKVKRLQRSNGPAKQAWIAYCDEELGGKHDPNRHPASALQAFLDHWVAESGEALEEPPPASLVERIKKVQRAGPKGKKAWQDYCDSDLGGV